MNAENEAKYQRALNAINDLFSDTTVDKSEAAENLQGLRDEIDLLLDSLQF